MLLKRNCSELLLVALFLFSPSVVPAAQIDVVSLGRNKPALVTVSGPIELSDYDLFLRRIAPLTTAIVAFNSDGGNLLAGIQIGETIRLKNFASLVPGGMRCASSCALAWLGGTRRFMALEAQIGFHAASDGKTGEVTSVGNALVGAYLNKIGLPYSAVTYITSPSPGSITWLNKSDAEKLGIEVLLYGTPTNPTVSVEPAQPQAKQAIVQPQRGDPQPKQYFVQVSSQRTEADARAAYKALQERFSILLKYTPMIQRVDTVSNGVFFRAIIGPFSPIHGADELCASLKSAGGQCGTVTR